MNLVERDAHVSDAAYTVKVGSKFRVIHEDGSIGYYIMTHPSQSPYELINIRTGEELVFQRGTMFIHDVITELNRLASREKLDDDVTRIQRWTHVPDERFNLEVNLKGLVL